MSHFTKPVRFVVEWVRGQHLSGIYSERIK